MKFAIVVLAVVAVVAAEPPHYRFRSQQQQAAAPPAANPAAEPAPYPPSGSAPYPASGKPSGPIFRLPERQQNQPPQTYYAPSTVAPSTAAPATTTESIETTTTKGRSPSRGPKTSRLTATDDAETVDTKDSDAEEGTDVAAPGVYYIYHPNGLLQRVMFTTAQDDNGNAYTAQLRYENVEPIRGPIFSYDPNTLQLQPIDVNQLTQQ